MRNCILTYYEHEPQVSLENDNYKHYRDHTLLMDKAFPFNQPDITLVDETKKCIQLHSNSINPQYTTHNCRKTKDLAFETNQKWQLNKIIVIPLVLFAMGSSLTWLIKASIYSQA